MSRYLFSQGVAIRKRVHRIIEAVPIPSSQHQIEPGSFGPIQGLSRSISPNMATSVTSMNSELHSQSESEPSTPTSIHSDTLPLLDKNQDECDSSSETILNNRLVHNS